MKVLKVSFQRILINISLEMFLFRGSANYGWVPVYPSLSTTAQFIFCLCKIMNECFGHLGLAFALPVLPCENFQYPPALEVQTHLLVIWKIIKSFDWDFCFRFLSSINRK